MTMKTIKVAEATNLQLDWLVAKCEGERVNYFGAGPSAYLAYIPKRSAYKVWRPSSNPVQMWPIIERERISCCPIYVAGVLESGGEVAIPDGWACFFAPKDSWRSVRFRQTGPTLLIAAARCYVASKLGETVEVPEELT